MFGIGMGPSPQQSELMRLMALSNLAPGGGMNPPLPANSAAGSQDMGAPPMSMASPEGGSPAPLPVGMFGAGFASQSPVQRMAGGGAMPMDKAPDGLPYSDQGGMPQFNMGQRLNDSLAANALMPKLKGHKGLFPGKDWISIVGILGDALAAGFGGQPQFGPAMMRRREAEQEHNRSLELWKLKAQLEREERMRPQVQEVGGSIGWVDPQAQSFKPFYTAPQPFEAYALARGLQPGTPEYQQAVQDYRLGAWSDPALDRKLDLEGVRYGYRDVLQDQRLTVTRRGQDIRSSDTRRGQDVRSRDTQRGQDKTDTRVRESAGFRGKGGKGGESGGDLIGPIYQRGKARIQWSKSQNKYVAVK